MPEGDTVWRSARKLHRALSGQVLTRAELRVPAHATADLTGALVVETLARGKHLLTRLTRADLEPVTLHTHLKMEGSWQVYSPGQPWRRPQHQARAVLAHPTRVAVGFSLGVTELLPTIEEASVVGHLGPDLLGPDWDPQEALSRLLTQPARPLRSALLDQRNLAGIGNMYAAELCFVSGAHPQTPVGEVPKLERLLLRAAQMLQLNKERPVQATTGDLREGRRLWVYRRDRSPCRRCGTPIEVAMFDTGDDAGRSTDQPSGRERAAYWCPRCQPGAPR